MQSFARLAVVFFLSYGYTFAQVDEDLLGLPVEYNLFGLDFRNDLYKDRDIFQETDPENSYAAPDDTIRTICEQYDLYFENQRIDCEGLKFIQKGLKIEQHTVHKREADETIFEGSGTDEEPASASTEGPVEEIQPAKEEAPFSAEEATETAVDVKEEAEETHEEHEEEPLQTTVEPEAQNDITEVPEEAEETTADESESAQVIEEEGVSEVVVTKEQAADNAEGKIPETEPEYVHVEEATEEKIEATTERVQVEEEVVVTDNTEEKIAEAVHEHAHIEAAATNTDDKIAEATHEDAVHEHVQIEETVTVVKEKGVPVITGRKLLPNGIEQPVQVQNGAVSAKEAAKADTPDTDKADAETIHEHQSGNAVIEGVNAGTLEASDAAVKNMATNAKIKGAPSESEEPKSGESAKETQQASKDTKVLIILFAVVVVVGAAAFAYSFIKKRKQKKAETARSENGGGAAISPGSAKADPEYGTELKPLMKTAETKPVVEYKDEKQSEKTENGN